MDNYYKILNISKDASINEIKKEYINEIKKYHPDLYKGDYFYAQNKTAKLNEIYSVLKDENLRKEYDKKIFGDSVDVKTNKEEPNIFKELKEKLKANFSKYSTANKKNKKFDNQLNKTPKKQIDKKRKNEIVCNPIKIEDAEKREKVRLSIMIGSIILTFILIIIFCLII